MIIETAFDFGDHVRVDGGDIVGVVTAFSLQGEAQRVMVEVSWFHNGEQKTAFFYEWRLLKIERF